MFNIQIEKAIFDKKQTNIAKGMAIIFLIWHHLFYNSPEYYDRFSSVFRMHGIPVECIFSSFCKVCVAIFLVLSGYGLSKSWKSYKKRKTVKRLSVYYQLIFVKNHLLKLMFSYWFIYLLFVPIGVFLGRSFWAIYNYNFLNGIIDFLGLAQLFGTPTMNATWWFMGIIIVYYILFPIFMKIKEYSIELWLIICLFLNFASFLPGFRQLRIWILPFAVGMCFAEFDGFDKIKDHNRGLIRSILVSVSFFITMSVIRFVFYHEVSFDSLYAIAVILLCFLVLSRIPLLNKLLEKFGEYSGCIFLFHSFIISYYFTDFIYWFKYSPIIFLVCATICFFMAFGISKLKKVTRFDNALRFCIQ